MDLAGLLADGARWALVTVFALAAAEKAQTLFHRAAAWHPSPVGAWSGAPPICDSSSRTWHHSSGAEEKIMHLPLVLTRGRRR